MVPMVTRVPDEAVQHAVDARHWRVVLGALRASFYTGSYARGVELVRRIADLAEQAGHHPDIDLRYARVRVVVTTHDAGGLTRKDVDLAGAISAAADDLGLAGEPARPVGLEIAIDALDIGAVLPFWRALLAYRAEVPGADGAPTLVDPDGIGPTVWFQQMDEARTQRNTIHLDVDVPHDVAVDRVAAVVAAGGQLVSARFAPSFWVLADAEGNEACVCTFQGREP